MNLEDALVKPEWPVRRVIKQIDLNRQAIAVLVDEAGKPLATITDGDIRRAILSGMDLDLPVRTLIDRSPRNHLQGPITAPEGTTKAALLKMMSDFSIRHVPIVDPLGRVVGIALLSDFIKDQRLPITAVVMAGGIGSRLRPLTEDLPKPMLPVGDKPILESIIEQLGEAGIRSVNLITNYKKEVIASHFGDGRDFGIDIQMVEEDQPLGTAGGLRLLESSDQPLLIINGDILTKVDFRSMLNFHQENGADMTVAVKEQEFCIPYGVVETDGIRIIKISEKPTIRHFISAGIYLLNPDVCRHIPSGQPYDMPDLIEKLLSEGLSVISFPVHEYWLDIGRVEDYQRAQDDSVKGIA